MKLKRTQEEAKFRDINILLRTQIDNLDRYLSLDELDRLRRKKFKQEELKLMSGLYTGKKDDFDIITFYSKHLR